MKKVDLSLLSKEIIFPVVQAIPNQKEKAPWYKRIFKFVTYRRKFKVKRDYSIWSPLLKQFIFTPCYFIFDGASVPKILSGIFSPNGILLLGSLPHDFGYRYNGLFLIDPEIKSIYFQKFSKSQLDAIFKDLCSWENKMQVASRVATLALSLFGFLGWRENRKLNLNLFKDFPELYVPDEEYIDAGLAFLMDTSFGGE